MSGNQAKQSLVAFTVGLIFACGLALSGMNQPQKILQFLDPWHWDPSLLFVMLGAVGVHVLTYPLIRRRSTPLLDSKWHVPIEKVITKKLLVGSALFGIGWGLGGFCPGPAITSLATLSLQPILFVGAMLIGMLVFKKMTA